MATFSVYTTDHAHKTVYVGSANSHEIPRIGEAFLFQNQEWRAKDIAHPTGQRRSCGIHIPRVLAVVEDIRWLDGTEPFGLPIPTA